MKIIILGAGQIGSTLAEYLLTEENDITVVDNDKLCLFRLQDRLDLRVILGYGSYPEVLREAGAEETDILIAATDSDEVNMIACQISHSLFSIPKRIACIKSIDYIGIENKIFSINQACNIFFIHPEKMIIDSLINLVLYPRILKIVYLFNKNIVLSVLRVYKHSNLVGRSITDIKNNIAGIDFIMPIIIRKNIPFFSTYSTVFEINDKLFLLCSSNHFLTLIKKMQYNIQKVNKNIMLVGGGHIGYNIAHSLEKKYNVKIIEWDKERAKIISRDLQYSTVLFGSPSDRRLLSEENIDTIDFFISATNNDEINIMSAMIAKKMGSKNSIALVKNKIYPELVDFSKIIDEIIFSEEVIISELLNYMRPHNIISKFLLQISEIEVIEIIIREKKNTNFIIGSLLLDIEMPSGVMIFAILRHKNIIFSSSDFDSIRIQAGDHIIMLLTNKINIKDIEKLF